MRRLKILLPLLALNSSPIAIAASMDEEHLDCLIEPNQVVELGTSVPGIVDRVLVERADTIIAGQPLIQLESSVEEATLRHAEERAAMDGTIKAHRADMNLARQNLKRIEKLFERQAISSQQRDEARAEYEVARRNYQVAQENKRLAQLEFETHRAKLERRVIRSPIDGVVIERLSVPGEFVDERPLLTLAQLDPLRVEVLIPASLFGAIQPGMGAEINPEVPVDGELKANVTTVDRLVDSASGTFRVNLELPNPGQRIPGGLKCGVRFLPQIVEEEPEDTAAQLAGNDPQPPTAPDDTASQVETIPSDPQVTPLTEISENPQPEEPKKPIVETVQPQSDSQRPILTFPNAPEVAATVETETAAMLVESSADVAETAPEPIAADEPFATNSPDSTTSLNLDDLVQPELIETTSDAAESGYTQLEAIEPETPNSPLPTTSIQPEPIETASDTVEVEYPTLAPLEPEFPNDPVAASGQEATPVVQTESIEVQPVRWCGTLRTSAPSEVLEDHIKDLRAADIEVSHDEFVSSVPRDFVVEMPLDSGSCRKVLGELRTAGFPDVACYRSKKTQKWVVSGGLFKMESYARTRQEEMTAKGFDVQLRTRYLTQNSQILYLEAESGSRVAETLHNLKLDQGTLLKETPCGTDKLAKH